jgi:glycosyltransferase involved in cell wall biosynthesis
MNSIIKSKESIRILHITAHLGGGIGSAYMGITSQMDYPIRFIHDIICLESTEKEIFTRRIIENGCNIYICPNYSLLRKLLEQADIVQINWWHHPLMAEFIYNFPNIPVRAAIWVHVSGCTYPYLRRTFLEKFDRVFFTTPYSYENAEVLNTFNNDHNRKSSVIYGISDVSRLFSIVPKKQHGKFRIGYMGTLSYSKLHPCFVDFSYEASKISDEIVFVMIGDMTNKNRILSAALQYGIENKIEFRGFCEDVGSELAQLDCMGYLLNPYHFGASENVILETMAAGVPIIMMHQATEKYIIKNNINGFLINNKNEYRDVIANLYFNPNIKESISRNARKRVFEEYSISKNNTKLYNIYEDMNKERKDILEFKDIFDKDPSSWFLYFIQNERNILEQNNVQDLPEIFKEESKASIPQYSKYFPQNENFKKWKKLMEVK